jgi:hypothetical protein
VLAHHEGLGGLRGQAAEAFLERRQELRLFERRVGVCPGGRRIAPVAGLVEERLELLVAARRGLAGRLADDVDDLVLEDAGAVQ